MFEQLSTINLTFIKERKNWPSLLLWLLVAVMYAPVLFQLYSQRWETIDYTHAYFILPVSLWLAWRDRKTIGQFAISYQQSAVSYQKKTAFTGLFLVILGLLMFIFGWRQEYLMISTVSMIPLFFGLLLYLYGAKTAALLSFPILYLLLMVPPPLGVLDSLTLPMRYGISVATGGILKTLGFPLIRDGLLLNIGGHEVYMGAPCSGFRSLITMISLGLVYAYINPGSMKRKALLCASIIPLAIMGNLIRVLGICLVTYYWGEKAGHSFHDYSGYGIFIALIPAMIGIDFLLGKLLKTK